MTKPRMMKILRAVVILALLMTSGIAIPVAAAGEVTVGINAPAEVLPGSDFTATIDIGSVTNFDAANYDISFNPFALRLDGVTNGNIGGISIPVTYWGQVPGEPPGTFVIINDVPGPNSDGSGGASGTGYLAVLHFHVLDTPGQSSNITLSNGVLGNTLALQIPAIWVGDSVQVVEVTKTLVSIAVTPTAPTIARGLTQQFTAIGTYDDTSTANLTSSANWTSSNATVASIGLHTGLATALAAGTTTITAVSGNIISNSATLTVTPATTVEVNNGSTLTLISGQFVPASSSAGIPVSIKNVATPAQGLGGYDFIFTWDANVIKIGRFVLSTEALVNRGFSLTPGVVDNVTGSFHIVGITTGGDTGYLKDNLTLGYLSVTAVGSAGTSTSLNVTINGLIDNVPQEIIPRVAVNAPVQIIALQSIAVTPTNPSVLRGHTQQFTAIGTYTDASTANLTGIANWVSSNTTVASIGLHTGLATSLAAGTTTITATAGSISGNTTLTVTAPPLVSIAVTPPNPSIGLGLSQQFTATGTYADSSTANLTGTATWVSSNTAVATINSAGLAAALAVGSTTILATSGGVSGNTSLTVTTAPLVSIAVTPPNPSISRGLKKQFNATGTYSDTSTANLTATATWTSSNTAVATINATGMATAVGAGTTTITATSGGIFGNTTLIVTLATTVEVNNGNTIFIDVGQSITGSSTGGIPINVKGIATPAEGLAAFDLSFSWNPNVIKISKFSGSLDAITNRGFGFTPGAIDNVTGNFHVVGTTTGGETGYLKDNLTLGYFGIVAVGGSGNSTSINVTINNLTDNALQEITPHVGVSAPVVIGVNLVAETGIAQGLSSSVSGVVVVKTNINRIKNLSDNSTTNITGGIGSYSATVNGSPGNAIQFLTVYGVPPFNGPTFDNITGVFAVPVVSSPIQPNNTTVAEVVPILTGNTATSVSLTISFQAIGAAGSPGLNVPELQPNTITFKRGDADKNGVISVVDSLAIKQYLVGQLALSAINPLNAATPNHDGASGDKINVVDALAVEQYLVGQRNSYYQ